ncbi:MAG TPA: protein kinase [Burkholderiales bacterium]|nr:protein kinase [Burkholderiales bacterium]
MRVLVIEESADAGMRIEKALRHAMPDVTVFLWNPLQLGAPPENFDWARHDCLLLADTPLNGMDAIEWLREYHRVPNFPPTIILADSGSEERAVRAVRAGAFDYLRKNEVTPIKVAMTIRESQLESTRAPRQDMTQPMRLDHIGQAPDPTVIVPGYRILRKIGQGGMSTVFLATRESDQQQLVLKVLDQRMRDDTHFRARLEREYRIISRIRNEHVAHIYDQGFGGEQAYIAMEYFPGGDLQQRIRAGMSSMAALKVLIQIAAALDAVHSADIVHRDLKPHNIMFRANNRLAILDFGLARELDAKSTLTQKGMVMATPLYMSPEQCVGQPHDPRGDLYSTGVILYEMLTGKHLYTGDNASQLAYQHVHAPIPQLPGRHVGYQPLLERLVAKNPADRFQNARELYNFIVH